MKKTTSDDSGSTDRIMLSEFYHIMMLMPSKAPIPAFRSRHGGVTLSSASSVHFGEVSEMLT
jgi:hypothetical protein